MKGAAAATSRLAGVAASEMLGRGGSAVDAVLAGFFAEAGAREDVLLAPISGLVAGAGAGERAFDGRAVQPGAGAERPKRFAPDETPPLVARVAVSRTIAAAALMHTSRGRVDMPLVVAAGVKAARDVGAQRRAALLEDIGEARMLAFSREPVVEALLAIGGRSAGGALSRADLASTPREEPALAGALGDTARVLRVPWAFEPAPDARSLSTESVVAIDARGQVAVLAYDVAPSIEVPGLQIAIPCIGIPVLRGVPRVAPGTALHAPAPIAIFEDRPGSKLALGFAGDPQVAAEPQGALSDDVLRPLVGAIPLDPAARDVARSLRGTFVCVALDRDQTRVVNVHAAA